VIEDEDELVRRPVVHAEEVTALEMGWNHARILAFSLLDTRTLRFYHGR
jgi:hypothetical protein